MSGDYVCVYVCVNECLYFWRESEQEKDIQREEREKHTQLIPREEKERHTDNSACLSPAGGEDTGGLQGESDTHLKGGRR